ncbi:hypothetical protein [Saccharothrix xinjiangensis]|uniref:Uncharacterized protein n=1 Tax=Saccharothrix xinjiangensis TaxID=204798 RepID=A0ABV9YBA4_9PSEU
MAGLVVDEDRAARRHRRRAHSYPRGFAPHSSGLPAAQIHTTHEGLVRWPGTGRQAAGPVAATTSVHDLSALPDGPVVAAARSRSSRG